MTAHTLNFPVPAGLDRNVAAYARAVNALPVLNAEEERALAVRYRKHNDLDAARQLVLAHLRTVVRISRGFGGYGLPQADLIQEGNIGLMKAVRHYDPDRGVRLVSFAVHWVKAEIYDYILRNWRIVKVATTKAQRKLFFNLRKRRERLGWMTPDERQEMAQSLNVSESAVSQMEGRLASPDVAFDGDVDADDESPNFAPAALLPDMRYNPEVLVAQADHASNRQEQLADALSALDERSRDIIRSRWLVEDKATLHDLAARYNVSAERIRQLEAKALAQMKDVLAA